MDCSAEEDLIRRVFRTLANWNRAKFLGCQVSSLQGRMGGKTFLGSGGAMHDVSNMTLLQGCSCLRAKL